MSEQRVTQNALNLQEVLFVMGGPSLDDSDDEDEDEDEDTDRRLHPRNCCFYNPKLGKDNFSWHSNSIGRITIMWNTYLFCILPVKSEYTSRGNLLLTRCSFNKLWLYARG